MVPGLYYKHSYISGLVKFKHYVISNAIKQKGQATSRQLKYVSPRHLNEKQQVIKSIWLKSIQQ